LEMSWYKATLAPAETRNAKIRTDSKRLFMYIYQLQKIGHALDMPFQKGLLAGGAGSAGQIGLGVSPNRLDVAARTDEQCGGGKRDECE
jgi:hypothetical protein